MAHINHDRKFIYITVPKTASTSMFATSFIDNSYDGARAVALCPRHPDYFAWGFVRNPYDRIYATYNYYVHSPDVTREIICRTRTFSTFVRHGLRDHPAWGFIPQWKFLCTDSRTLAVDFVGRFETLSADWNEVCRRIGVSESLPHKNRTRHHRWQDAYTHDDMLHVVNETCCEDFRIFGYPVASTLHDLTRFYSR